MCQWDGFIIRRQCKQQAGKVYNCSQPDMQPSVPERWRVVNMSALPLLLLSLVPVLTRGQVVQTTTQPDLPVLFSFSQPSHNVAVFRGADLQRAIASGAVRGFGAASSGGLGVSGVGHHGVAFHHRAPIVATPAVVHPIPVATVAHPVYHPPAPTRVVAPVVHHSHVPTLAATYVDPHFNDLAEYSFEYGVEDNISGSQFGDHESRFELFLLILSFNFHHSKVRRADSGPVPSCSSRRPCSDGDQHKKPNTNTNPQVTYTVDGPSGYVATVEYSGEAVYPDLVGVGH